MTVELTDRIDMPDSDELDDLFEALERMPVPEGYKAEIVEGTIHMAPHRHVHGVTIRRITNALERRFGNHTTLTWDERIDFPGCKNGFCPDVAKLRDGAAMDHRRRWRYQDVEFIAEVISRGTGANDYGEKWETYASAAVPAYLIADPYTAKCHLYTDPKGTGYETQVTIPYGQPVDLSQTPANLVLPTDDFPREQQPASQ